jgi:hypothetical protein
VRRALRSSSLPLFVLGLGLTGCGGLAAATRDSTALRGDIPAGLGRSLDVRAQVGDAALEQALLGALRHEFESRDLFDRVEVAPLDSRGGAHRAALLEVTLVSRTAEEVFDPFDLDSAWVERVELEIDLADASGQPVLTGHVTGVGVDAVSEPELLDELRRQDVSLSALHDAAMKLSRALRLVADQRARKALDALPTVRLPPGVGPLDVAILGFQDEESGRLPRGPLLAEHLAQSLERLGPDVGVLPADDVSRALREARSTAQPWGLDATQIQGLARRLPTRVFVGGKVSQVAGKVEVTARVMDRRGQPVGGELRGELRVEASGLGALRIAAADLARAIGEVVLANPPPAD